MDGAGAGREVDVTITFLEMAGSPQRPPRPKPVVSGWAPLMLLRAENPPVGFFRYLYGAVGGDYDWTDLLRWDDARLGAFVQDAKVELWPLYRSGVPLGFFQLDFREERVCDLAYFGLMPEAVGLKIGPWFLDAAIREAWSREIDRMTVNTCTLDHPAALGVYQRAGFAPVRRVQERRVVGDKA